MNLFEYNYGGKKLCFRMSNSAMVEIEKRQKKNLKEINPEIFKTAVKMKDIKEEYLGDKESFDLLIEALPLMEELDKLESFVAPDELMYLLLHCSPEHRELSKEEWDLIVWDMEENLGFEVVAEKFREVHEKVFTMVDLMKNPKKETVKPKSKRTSKKNMEA